MKTVIIGAGISGLSAAYHLREDYVVLEKDLSAGGLTRSVKADGYTFDVTGHLLHLHTPYASRLVKYLLGGNFKTIYRDSRIYSNGTMTRYPFQANLYGLPPKIAKECITGFVDSIMKYGLRARTRVGMGTFREWVLRNFGSGFGKHFFFPYNEKLWAVSPDVLTDDWTGKFVPRPSLEDVVLGAFYDLKKGYGYNVSFLYPRRGGIQALTDAFTEKVKNLRFGTRVGAVDWKRRRIETDSCEYTYENLISTIPMAELLGILKDPPAEIVEVRNKLKWNSILCMNLGFSRAGIGGDLHWIYFPEKKFPFYRVGFYHNFSPCLVPEGASSMYIEISRPGGTLPEAGKLFPAALRGLAGAGLIRRGEKPEVVNIIPVEYAYVIYDKNRSAAVKAALGFLEKHGIFSIGRYGAWKYSYIEESITDGLKTALRINHGRNKKS